MPVSCCVERFRIRRAKLAATRRIAAAVALHVCLSLPANAQVLAAVQGRAFDPSGAVVGGATVRARNESTTFEVSASSDDLGRYYLGALPNGTYTLTAAARGFRVARIAALTVDVGRVIVYDFHLELGGQTEAVDVHADMPLLDRASSTVGHLVTASTMEKIPLNGRHFTDLGLIVPGSVAPSQAGFSSRPIRGVGALAFNTAGNREEAVAFLVNGVSTNNLTFGSLIFEPPLASIDEVKIDNSVFAAEHGHVSGAIVNIATRSGSDEFRGEAFEFFRNDALDARNFFEFTSRHPHPFRRNQFGGSVGGPIRRGSTFFFVAYEGLRQRQGIDLNSLVLSDEQRASVTDPVVRQLLPLIPAANFIAADGTPRFVGSAPAVADTDRWTLDVRHNLGQRDRIEMFYGSQHVRAREPAAQGNSIPGWGQVSRPSGSTFTLSQMHVFGSSVNEARFGRAHLTGGTFPANPLNPVNFGVGNGVTRPIGLPQFVIAGDLNFGGPGTLPQGRIDTSYVLTDSFSRAIGRHVAKAGGEYRHFVNENFAEGTGAFNFPSVAAFLTGTANAFTITLGERRSIIDQRAAAIFVQDQFTVRDGVTLDVGVRYEWHLTPTERHDAFVVFDAASGSLIRLGIDRDDIYRQNFNLEPRLGIAWDVSAGGRTVVRAAYGKAVDEPGTTAVRDTAGNPPFAVPLTAGGVIPIGGALDGTRPAGLAPATVDPAFRNAVLRSWNVNVQRQLSRDMAATLGYSGSRGSNLRLSRNINQPVDGVRPFPAVSSSSSILPGTPLGNITQVESSGYSSYHSGWIALSRRLSQRLQFDTSLTWSKSLDTNSLNSSGFAVQNAYDIPGQYGLSDFDARLRFVFRGWYLLPFTGHALTRGWQVSAVVQAQSGNPVNIVTSNSSLNGTANTVRPDLIGPVDVIGSVDRWFDPSVFVAVNRFGTLGRNAVIGPAFHNTDVSVIRNLELPGRVSAQVRVDVFDLFNHPNFGPPGNIVGSPGFGKITRTRLPTGEAGSSRQIQLAAQLSF
jgi:hypothetical protein